MYLFLKEVAESESTAADEVTAVIASFACMGPPAYLVCSRFAGYHCHTEFVEGYERGCGSLQSKLREGALQDH